MVKFYLDLNLSGTSTAKPGVPSIDIDGALASLPVIASTSCNHEKIEALVKFQTDNSGTYNWDDGAGDFSDFTFVGGDTTAITSAQAEIFDINSHTWLTKFYAKEHAQYTGGDYNAGKASKLQEGTAGEITGASPLIDDYPKLNGTLPETQRSVSKFLANKIAQKVFGHAVAYDIFDNEREVFEQCTEALESMASTIAQGFVDNAQHVGETLIARILAGHHGDVSDNTTGGDPQRFSGISDTATNPIAIPLRAGDEIYVRCSSLTVSFTDPLDNKPKDVTALGSDGEDFLVLIVLTGED